jgi:8-oxo-dGTP pyrophosphatase MutT (NUDIX family)
MAEPRSTARQISAGVILVDPHGRILLQLRDSNPKIMFPDHWGITGGAGNPGETPEDIARREVLEETGMTPGRISPFRAYYFEQARDGAGRKKGSSAPASYELYLYHAPCETPAEDMHCGEGRALRFFAPHELPTIDIAYNHRDVLEEFFASPYYPAYLRGTPFNDETSADDDPDPVQHFRDAVAAGDPWFDALMEAIALWERPVEEVDGRRYRYLIGGEAFDWLLLAERILSAAGSRVPEREVERLLFEGRAPDADGAGTLDDERLRELLGASKHRAHLNFVYGVTVEEALQYAVELDVAKERRTIQLEDGRGEPSRDPVFERIYGRTQEDLLLEFRESSGLPHTAIISQGELREFQYWLFQYRVRASEPARVASDTRKALARLSAMEDAVRRSGRRSGPRDATPVEEILQEVR